MTAACPDLVETWQRGRSLARGITTPVREHGGWRVEIGTPAETRRYVFAAPCEGLQRLAATVVEPRIFLKLCASDAVLHALLPAGWVMDAPGVMMTCGRWMNDGPTLPGGYRLETTFDGAAWHTRIVAPDGRDAAGGFAARHADAVIYDRIVTAPDHRRKRLGHIVMASLQSAAYPCGTADPRGVLVATEAGQALYAALDWSVHAPYASAVRRG